MAAGVSRIGHALTDVAADRAQAMVPRHSTACLAGFHAAQAFIFERTGKSVKTHKGVQTELHRLTRADPGFAAVLILVAIALSSSRSGSARASAAGHTT